MISTGHSWMKLGFNTQETQNFLHSQHYLHLSFPVIGTKPIIVLNFSLIKIGICFSRTGAEKYSKRNSSLKNEIFLRSHLSSFRRNKSPIKETNCEKLLKHNCLKEQTVDKDFGRAKRAIIVQGNFDYRDKLLFKATLNFFARNFRKLERNPKF